MHPTDPRRDAPYQHDRPRHAENSAHSVDDGQPRRRVGLWVGVLGAVLAAVWIASVVLR